jgi:sugar phosphate isomerase/epimerase
MYEPLSRRRLLQTAALAVPLSVASARPAQLQPVRFGGPAFTPATDPAAFAEAHRRLGYRAAYGPEIPITDQDRIRAVREECAARDVVIAEVGAWVNLQDPDPVRRHSNFGFVAERLALAEELGALCCVDIAGSWNSEVWYGPHPGNFSRDFFDATVETTRRLIDLVKPRRTRFCLEMMGWVIPSGPDEYLELIRAIDRPAFGVHLDVCNAVNSPDRIYHNDRLTEECFDKLGRWIVSCHAKDLAWVPGMQVHFVEVIPGRGVMDYRPFFRKLSRLPHSVPVMLEHLSTSEEYREGRNWLGQVALEVGVPVSE